MAEEPETIEPEIDKEINLKKEYELNDKDKKYNLKIYLDNNEIIFELNLISEISYYNYIKKYKYNDIIKELNLSNINDIYNYFDKKNIK